MQHDLECQRIPLFPLDKWMTWLVSTHADGSYFVVCQQQAGCQDLHVDVIYGWQLQQEDVSWGGKHHEHLLINPAEQQEASEIVVELMNNPRAQHKPVLNFQTLIRATRFGTGSSTTECKAEKSSCIGI